MCGEVINLLELLLRSQLAGAAAALLSAVAGSGVHASVAPEVRKTRERGEWVNMTVALSMIYLSGG